MRKSQFLKSKFELSIVLILFLLACSVTVLNANIQGGGNFNSSTTGAANTAVTVTVTAVAGRTIHIYGISAFCSAGTSNIVVASGGTNVFTTPATFVGTSLVSVTWPVALTSLSNSNVIITLATCGAGNTGTLQIQGDQF